MIHGSKNLDDRYSFSSSSSNWKRDSGGRWISWFRTLFLYDVKKGSVRGGGYKGSSGVKKHVVLCGHIKSLFWITLVMALLLFMDSVVYSAIQYMLPQRSFHRESGNPEDNLDASVSQQNASARLYNRLLSLASSAVVKNEVRHRSMELWTEPYGINDTWRPCADRGKESSTISRVSKTNSGTGYIMVSANGGLNQQRVAVCNAVAVTSLLNASLVLPKFLYSSVWKDISQFGDIYQEEHFLDSMKEDIRIVKELPSHLRNLDLEAVGSLITDMDIEKEAKPIYFLKTILPLLLKNKVVHFLGFGNRLAFDPLPSEIQRLRCKCNFHALRFSSKIQKTGSLLIRRIRKYDARWSPSDEQLLGQHLRRKEHTQIRTSRYLALHLRFEIDMLAYSLCEFGGGEHEREELQAYREIHFPTLIMRMKNSTSVPTDLWEQGRCPLTPEETALMLAAIGFQSSTPIFVAGSNIYGGKARMAALSSLYPNIVTKEDLLSKEELAPFRNFSSQMAALDFIACAAADVFAMTDSGSQLSSLVSGYRTYFGNGQVPTLRPNKRRYARFLSVSETIEWPEFENRVRQMINEYQKVQVRPFGKSVYKNPRTPECMCKDVEE